jgi:hypothetical protein
VTVKMTMVTMIDDAGSSSLQSAEHRLGAMRGPRESYSNAILRLVVDSPCR